MFTAWIHLFTFWCATLRAHMGACRMRFAHGQEHVKDREATEGGWRPAEGRGPNAPGRRVAGGRGERKPSQECYLLLTLC